jgi:alkanesulfonate monooxygenase SsuD/methylene tetrahydromethanopterin reductase-like flavin-dependent oxidoreductase (luciferase family)
MHFGLRLPSFALGEETASLTEMGAYLRHAEDLGFDSALLIDHLLVAPPAYRTTWLEPITLLSALAGVTRTIRLGTLVLVLPFREPVQFAKQWATLDVLSGGRSILGVGVGWMEAEFEAVGIPHRERGARMNELLELITALWTQESVTYAGKYYRVNDLRLDPKPADGLGVGQPAVEDHLQGHRPVGTLLVGHVNDAHPPSPHLPHELVVPEVFG